MASMEAIIIEAASIEAASIKAVSTEAASIEAVSIEADTNASSRHGIASAHERESVSDICRLPFELLARVISHLPLADRAHAATSCALMRHAVDSFYSPLHPPPSLLPSLTFLDLKAGSPCLDDAAFAALCRRLGAAGVGAGLELGQPLGTAGVGEGGEWGEERGEEGGGGGEEEGGKKGGDEQGAGVESVRDMGGRRKSCLRRLELDCWHLSDRCTSLLPESIEELALCGADKHTDALIQGLADRLGPNLTKFAFSGFSRSIGSDSFVSLLSVSPCLASLAIDAGEGLHVGAVVMAAGSLCPNLRELSVYDISMETLVYLSTCHLPHLTRFRHKRRHEWGMGLTDAVVMRIVRLCPNLEELLLVDKAEGVGHGRGDEVREQGCDLLTCWP
ncbi:hypothetical protein CLOM_g4986 [Closterium sp. NIES-68]|nr:hypothetical protein CLOM_g4986 [Closterium sp. NIES-68]